ncbi:HD-GYP domain-containing protein [Geosporobacter ferrireducens]|uniref:HD-GYP domain-containing protein n=1 Tax=Geosporobacter ferrireducens TaxID=1424294 RepID=UPI00139DA1DE|nr:HD domain-containing phosphohydrolase [Geosporobacter ferrireducens]MTI53772.1 HD domain-containing protein [Geosporobacter ferrireducens]
MFLNKSTTPIQMMEVIIPEDVIAHGQRVGNIAYRVAVKLKLSDIEKRDVIIASRIHDYGKAWVRKEVLRKPGKLTVDEYEEMKLHALYGSQMAKVYKKLRRYGEMILYHHEKIDGSGYFGLTDKQIPLISKIIVISDIFDALSSNRDYRRAYSTDEVIKIMSNESYKYDRRVFEAFLRVVDCKNLKPEYDRILSLN